MISRARGRKRKVLVMKGNLMWEYQSTCEAAREVGLTQQVVYNHLKSGNKHKASGYFFAFGDVEPPIK